MNGIESNYKMPAFRAKPIPKKTAYNTIKELLSKDVKSVDIYCHFSTDEDAINSAKVFYNWLVSCGKQPEICVPESEVKKLYFNPKKYKLKTSKEPADKTVVLDCNSKTRLNQTENNLIEKVDLKDVIIIDHHVKNDNTLGDNFYIDDSAKSCCSILFRFFESIGRKLSKKDLRSLFCGMLSDYKKSGNLRVFNDRNEYIIGRTNKIENDKYSLEVFEKLDKALTSKEKNSICKHLDTLSRLTKNQRVLQKRLYENIQLTKDGQLAYVVIPPTDKLWEKVGMDNTTTSEILKDLRVRVVEHRFDSSLFSKKQREKLKNVNTVICFYRKSKNPENGYCMSIHSKNNTALDLIENAQRRNPNIIGGGHKDRAGGRILSVDKKDVGKFISAVIS